MIFIGMTAGLAAIVLTCIQFDGSKDHRGRSFLGRIDDGSLDTNDRLYLKMVAGCVVVAALCFAAA